MFGKTFRFLLASLIVAAAFQSGSASRAQTGWTGTITMYAQAYTPNATIANKNNLKQLQAAADAWQASHPGVTIQFVDEEFQGYNDVVRAKAAAGELWDVFWAQWSSLNNGLPEGIAVDLAPYFEQPNPYATDAAAWKNVMNETIINETKAPGGQSYNINGDYVATAFFYNKALFAKAGITNTPTTWTEMLETAKKLKDAGIEPLVGVPYFGWMQRHFLSNFYSKEWATLAGADKQPGFSALDEAIAVNNGTLSTKDARLMGWWPLYKELAQYYVPDYLVQPSDANSAAEQDFIGGKAAIYYSGSWFPNNLRAANVSFEFGSFNFPSLTGVSQFDTGHDASGAVGGPSAAYQYAISTPRANRSMEEAGKMEVVLDWLQYLGTPKVAEAIINENGGFVPTWPGTKGAAGLESLAGQATSELISVQITRTSPELDSALQTTFGLYISGNITIEEATTQVQQALDSAVKDYETQNNVDLSQYK